MQSKRYVPETKIAGEQKKINQIKKQEKELYQMDKISLF